MTSSSRVRAGKGSIYNYTCPICNKPQRTEGWRRYHLKKFHPDVNVNSYRAREENRKDYDRYFIERGFRRCPHIRIWCPGPNCSGPEKCRGKEDCVRLEHQPWLAGLFEEVGCGK